MRLNSINEQAGEGNDRVAASVSYVLSNDAHIELLEAVNLTATDAFDLTGSDSANTITGNDGVNVLRGQGGNDTLNGAGGDDFLVGGTGEDSMTGGAGNDTYYVDRATDDVFELAGEGSNDRVVTSGSYNLGAVSQVERLEAATQSATDPMTLRGGGIANIILGNDGPNTLNGAGGNDMLTGFGGADVYEFSTSVGPVDADTIIGFVSASDKISLNVLTYTALSPGALPAGAFVVDSAAQDSNDRILYNSQTGQLYYDPDGNGGEAAKLFATLQGAPALVASDFMVF